MAYTHGTLENRIMNVIWEIEENAPQGETPLCSVTVVLTKMNETGNSRAYTTVKTVMDRLVNKNLLVRGRLGKKFSYSSTTSRINMAKEAIESLADQYFHGNIAEMSKAIEKEYASVLV